MTESEVISFRRKQLDSIFAELESMLDDGVSPTKEARSATSAAYYDKKQKKINEELAFKGLDKQSSKSIKKKE